MKLKLGYQELIAQAMAQIETLPLEQAQRLLDDENVIFVDIRDVKDLNNLVAQSQPEVVFHLAAQSAIS